MDEQSAPESVENALNSIDVTTVTTAAASSSTSVEVNVEEERGRSGVEDQEPRRMWMNRSLLSYRLNLLLTGDAASPSVAREDLWSCLVVVLTFWFFASMTLILGFYGSTTITLGPNGSRIIQVSSFFVQSIKVQELDSSASGPMLYSFDSPPALDVEKNWSEEHNVSIVSDYHKEWLYFLNKGSKVEIYYRVKNPTSSPLSLVIAQGVESLVEWIEDPSYPNTTLSWNIIHGSGKITHDIPQSSNYYIAVGNLNSDDVEVLLKFELKTLVYNTSMAYHKCYLSNSACSVTLSLFGKNAAVLTSPGPEEGIPDGNWYFKQSDGPRWLVYLAGSGVMTVLLLFTFRICNMFQRNNNDVAGGQPTAQGSERDPLLNKDDDLSSWGSSYDSVSQGEDDLDEWLVVGNSLGANQGNDVESHPPRRQCVICCDEPRDCFFLPCGHCAACFACGSRIAEEDGHCPICRRKMKKVRMIFTV
ncbi:unnamed protein product [Rhodiola kirilowii]